MLRECADGLRSALSNIDAYLFWECYVSPPTHRDSEPGLALAVISRDRDVALGKDFGLLTVKRDTFWISETWPAARVPFSEAPTLTFGEADYQRRRRFRIHQSETEKPRGTHVCTRQKLFANARALEPEAASAGAPQEMGKNQRCSHRTCGHRTFPITATEAPSAQVRLGELCGHRQRWWPLCPLRP